MLNKINKIKNIPGLILLLCNCKYSTSGAPVVGAVAEMHPAYNLRKDFGKARDKIQCAFSTVNDILIQETQNLCRQTSNDELRRTLEKIQKELQEVKEVDILPFTSIHQEFGACEPFFLDWFDGNLCILPHSEKSWWMERLELGLRLDKYFFYCYTDDGVLKLMHHTFIDENGVQTLDTLVTCPPLSHQIRHRLQRAMQELHENLFDMTIFEMEIDLETLERSLMLSKKVPVSTRRPRPVVKYVAQQQKAVLDNSNTRMSTLAESTGIDQSKPEGVCAYLHYQQENEGLISKIFLFRLDLK